MGFGAVMAVSTRVVVTPQDLERLAEQWDGQPDGLSPIERHRSGETYPALTDVAQILVAVVDVATRKVVNNLLIPAQEPRAITVADGKLYVVPFESNNQTQLSGGKAEDIDGDLVTFDARKLASAFDSVGFTVDVVKNPEIPDRDLFIFDTKTDELIATVDSLGTNLFGVAVDGAGNVFVAGFFEGTANFGGGNLVSAGLTDIYLAKFFFGPPVEVPMLREWGMIALMGGLLAAGAFLLRGRQARSARGRTACV